MHLNIVISTRPESDPRDGYDYLGPNTWIRGDRDYLYYEQNELVDIDPNPRYYMRADVNSSSITEKDREYHSELATTLSTAGAGASIYSSFHVLDGNFRGASGNYYYIEGRTRWNGSTGTRAHMENAIRRANMADAAGRGLAVLSVVHTGYQYHNNEISGLQFGFETSSTFIQGVAPFPFNFAWTIGYEGLGRQGVARLPWYQNNFKPWARNQLGIEATTTRP